MLFEKLSQQENEMINHLRHDYLYNSNAFCGEFVDNQTFLRFWETAKAPLAEAFGGNLIIRKPIQSIIDADELAHNMSALWYETDFKRMRDGIIAKVREYNTNYSARIFPDPVFNPTNQNYKPMCSMEEVFLFYVFCSEAWVANKYDGPTCEISVGNGKVIKWVHGCKIMKTLGRFARECGYEQEFEYLRLRQSQILNEANIHADLCLSIHPLDFMTASFNESDWRSCMCWDDGEFRRGVIEMMNSPVVVVAYIASSSANLHLGYNRWNSKRWREFFIVTPKMISGIKGYPYWNRRLEDEALNWMRELFAPVFNADYVNKIYTWRTEDIITDTENNIFVHPSMRCGPAMYNDFYNGNDYHSIFAHGVDYHTESRYKMRINYSGESECVVCGSADNSFDSESYLSCCECFEHYTCEKCGCTITNSEDVVIHNDRVYCRYCWESLPSCDICGEVIDEDFENIYEFVVGWDENTDKDVMKTAPRGWGGDRLIKAIVCEECASDIFCDGIDEFSKELHTYKLWNRDYIIVPLSHITEKGKELLFNPDDIKYFIDQHKDKERASA